LYYCISIQEKRDSFFNFVVVFVGGSAVGAISEA